ncbi:ScbR family autoregulator-binding transcription factor [Kitasatospora sp. NPDC093550]|uniref:ScbR family autoregulator-binding transcription factor n=1 Tax=Kitasatospora sp. NPDC093550 TaxID=3364089 RepID=UPI00381BE6CF
MVREPGDQGERTLQKRALRTRENILRAAAEVFDEYGFSGASVTKITRRAKVTQGAVYFHFGSKEGLARAVMIGQGDDLELPGGTDGLQRLIDITLYLAEQLQTNPVLRGGVRLAVEQGEFGLRDDQAYQQWVEVFREQFTAARERGELRPAVDVGDLSWLLVSCFSGTQLFSQISTDRADLPQRIVLLWHYLLPGIAVDEVRGSLRVEPRTGAGGTHER